MCVLRNDLSVKKSTLTSSVQHPGGGLLEEDFATRDCFASPFVVCCAFSFSVLVDHIGLIVVVLS